MCLPKIKIEDQWIGGGQPTYFIADIAANHDGDLERAKKLIHQAAEAGADAAKFQNFQAEKIVSDAGFSSLNDSLSHQAKWKTSVFDIYKKAALPWAWTETLKEECDKVGIAFFSAPYDFGAVDMLDSYMSMYKIGSGDITWLEIIEKIAGKGKPVMLATGASDLADVQRAVDLILATDSQLVLMQCNTNYTASLKNFNHTHLNVLKTYHLLYPDVVLGLSDHTPGHTTVLGAVALGASVIEKHFTDDNNNEGPDHVFSMNPGAWREMVDRTRELEYALGSTQKRVADNEQETVVIQRRSLYARQNLKAGVCITRNMIDVLRPAPDNAIFPYDIDNVVGKCLRCDLSVGSHFQMNMLNDED